MSWRFKWDVYNVVVSARISFALAHVLLRSTIEESGGTERLLSLRTVRSAESRLVIHDSALVSVLRLSRRSKRSRRFVMEITT